MRSYDEYCSVAKALDLVGDRWTLLVVRELSLRGPVRYTDLRNGLPGVATNLLADRLRDPEGARPLLSEKTPGAAFRSHCLAAAVELMVSDGRPDGKPVTLELRIGDEPIV